ncbi:hypothetical protein ABFS82_02G044000 [Erythranthe guttata]|uniref:BHLH domain-containing protein n=1 Tax=Erythranthe guttata TaxID=4155 RepID=A0A022RB65_ERYGU|nr:PREDICTED: transcription factor bHLH54-like [Erythranthe guttata]EYU37572.1 hypothetical protein MIMGU_mgv1a024176mg [Erythranthe guttata]|eukprot:XP_012836777.1 PREDICTED: transcription factor bHLH54-like [Erythranthe guttata]
MEHIGAISEREWTSLNGMCSEEAEFMSQFLGNCSSYPNEVTGFSNFPVSCAFWPSQESTNESAMYSSDETNTSVYSFSQGSGYSGGIVFPFSSNESYHHHHHPSGPHQVFLTNSNLMTMDYCTTESKEKDSDDFLNHDVSNDSVESMSEAIQMPDLKKEEKYIAPLESKKRSRVSSEVQRNKRSTKTKKCAKIDDNEEDNCRSIKRQNSSSCFSEDESNVSHEMNSSSKLSGALNLDGKTRASRGSATDPQSLYARKRRERINERLRILQNLVPNGTKVDISTMLEEAVEYVKFLQLQIKLLSSDDLWMYSPIAYNGMDIGLDLRIATPKPQS